MDRGVPGRDVPVKKSIRTEVSQAKMVSGRNDPEPSIYVQSIAVVAILNIWRKLQFPAIVLVKE